MGVKTQPHLVEIVAALKEITARITSAATVSVAIDDLLDVTATLLPEHAHCAVALVRDGEPATFAAKGLAPEVVDEAAYAGGDGPCMQAIRTREFVLSQDLQLEQRWPAWSAEALRQGVYGVLSYPFDVDTFTLGAFNLYAERPEEIGTEVSTLAMLVADHASLLLRIQARALLADQMSVTDPPMPTWIDDATLQRAIGIVMAQRGCPPDQALRHLDDAATQLGVPVESVAERLVRTVGERAMSAAQ